MIRRSQNDFRNYGNESRTHSRSLKKMVIFSKEAMKMDIRQKIIGLLNKIDSETLLKRIYEFIKYIYIYQ